MKIVIIDGIGLVYDGETVFKRGLGGSESAVILMARELVKLGFEVVVYNSCEGSVSKPGIYDGVEYRPFSHFPTEEFDIAIASRDIGPFLNSREEFNMYVNSKHSYEFCEQIRKSKYKILWLHDTFCVGDQLIEDYIVNGYIDELFTLSDFHTSYITTCAHGPKKRNFEVLKPNIFQTRNGIFRYKEWVDIKDKDPNLFVYNASITKGMIPLVTKIWPEIHNHIPQAKLKIIGGYYRFRDEGGSDEAEDKWHALKNDYEKKNIGIEFTGVIPQKEIAEIVAKSSYMIYPGAFPETFSISILESLAYNTPIIGTRFGAMEETAIDHASYLIDYAIEPNSLFPHIDSDRQCKIFVQNVLRVYNNPYLHQQKMNYCNVIKDICGWDSVAKQWKQRFYQIFNKYLPVEEYREVNYINTKVHKVFNRRFSNKLEFSEPKTKENRIVCIVPFYNSEKYIETCIKSIASQDYDNYKVYLINDASTDKSFEVLNRTIMSFNSELANKFHLITNTVNIGAVYNQINTIRNTCHDDDIIMLIDGDDALAANPDIFNMYNNLYNRENVEFTYGSMWSLADNIPLIAQPYPPEILETKSYRKYKFNWNMPYTHLRTFRKYLINSLQNSDFVDENGNWYRAGGDNAVFYNIIEQADPKKIRALSDIVYLYNDLNPDNDYKIHSEEQNKNAEQIIKRNKPKKEFKELVELKNETVDGVGPWVWRKNDPVTWHMPKRDWEGSIKEGILRHVKKFDVVVQAGGCQGMYPRLLSDIFQRVYTFEPNPTNFTILNQNCDKENIFKFQAALGAYNKLIDLRTVNDTDGGVIYVKDGNKMPVMTIDSLELDACDLIELDIETYEMYAIIGAIKTIEKFKPIITIEGPEVNAYVCNGILAQLGYEEQDRVANDSLFVYTGKKPNPMSYIPLDQREQPKSEITKKKILIAIPTSKYVESECFKSIYDQEIPEGYEVDFQCFYGYNVEQVRNLIANWVVNGYDYLFAVDYDMVFKPDTLKKLLSHDKDIVTGMYIQRIEGQHNLELYAEGGRRINLEELTYPLMEIGSCGFGCVLVKKQVFVDVGYPQFKYFSALDHKDTISEDGYFCGKAREKGFRIWVDTRVICDHVGSTKFIVGKTVSEDSDKFKDYIRKSSKEQRIPPEHVSVLHGLSKEGIKPKVIYDIGASILHWTHVAKPFWPSAKFYAFEAVDDVEFLFKEEKVDGYYCGILSDKDGKIVDFYQNKMHPSGNSYYKQNNEVNSESDMYFGEENKITKIGVTLDSIVKAKNFPLPEMIKIDTQGSELDIIKGADMCLDHATDLIIELQHVEYNKGAPRSEEVIEYLKQKGFHLVCKFAETPYDADYYFKKFLKN